jgi:hypothetical protein
VVCLLSAAAVHDLTDEIPMAVQIAVPRRTWPPKLDHPPVEAYVWDPLTFELALDTVEVAPGEWARIYSPGRTVVDLMRMRHKLGESVRGDLVGQRDEPVHRHDAAARHCADAICGGRPNRGAHTGRPEAAPRHIRAIDRLGSVASGGSHRWRCVS